MLWRKVASLAGVFLMGLTLMEGLAQPQQLEKSQKVKINKKWKVIDGFRSAKFGMNEKQVIKAIGKDFKIPPNKIKQKIQSSQKTAYFMMMVPNLMHIGGTAKITYIFGYKSKRLIHVNVDWGKGMGKNKDPKVLEDAAILLRNHFTKNRYQEELYAVNAKVNDKTIIVFRGQDKKNRMIYLRLYYPQGTDKKKAGGNIALSLSYSLNAKNPDTFDTTKGTINLN